MRNDPFAMPRLLLLALLVTGCTERNPQACHDGICPDVRYPFCDSGGEVAGQPDTCIAVSCTPGEFETCRGDHAITCDAAGNDYELIQCPLGCDAATGGCRECSSDSQCSNPSPVCDTGTAACRSCQVDDECASSACELETGACVAETAIVYASPTGAATGECTRAQPCSLARAVSVATTASVTPTLRMTAGTFETQLDIRSPTSKPLAIVATGARIVTQGAAVVVSNGANASIRGVSTFGKGQIWCGGPGMPTSRLTVRDAQLVSSAFTDPDAVRVERCELTLRSTEIAMNRAESAIAIGDDSVVDADRIRVHHTGFTIIGTAGVRVKLRVTNSLLENIYFALSPTDSGPPGSSFVFGFDTFTLRELYDQALPCGSGENRTLLIENSIVWRAGPSDVVDGVYSCTFVGTVLWPQAGPHVGGTVVDPKFIAPEMRDFHLSSTSPAIDAAVASQSAIGPDFGGTPRPQGAKADLGAYEYKP